MQVRCLLEGVGVGEMLEGWHAMLPAYMQKWGLDRKEVSRWRRLIFQTMGDPRVPPAPPLASRRVASCWPCPHPLQLVELFGSTRDEWMAADLDGWLAPNRIYPGVADVVRALMASSETYIVTTKQARFTETIIRQMAGIPFPMDRIFSQTVSGRPKAEVLAALAERHPGAGALHFVEDKFSTLEKVGADPAMDAWRLYLVDW